MKTKPIVFFLGTALMLLLVQLRVSADDSNAVYAVKVSATVSMSPLQIVLSWPTDNSSTFAVKRKLFTDTSWGSSLTGGSSGYTDSSVSSGQRYEYQVIRSSGGTPVAYGYVSATTQAPAVEDRGKVLLLVDNTIASSLATEISRLMDDLVGDGWQVARYDVPRDNDDPQSAVGIKNIIRWEYQGDTTLSNVFLLGHVPVPYSGYLCVDGHSDHCGAWAADAFYADADETTAWDDSADDHPNSNNARNDNNMGDGKWDDDTLPSSPEIGVGRVDFANITPFDSLTTPETDLLRRYLNKNHDYRHKVRPGAIRCV